MISFLFNTFLLVAAVGFFFNPKVRKATFEFIDTVLSIFD